MQRQLAERDGPASAAQRGSRLEQQVRQTMQERRAGDLDERGFGAGLPAFQERDELRMCGGERGELDFGARRSVEERFV